MELWSRIIAKLISGILSILDSSNLRNRLYSIQNEHEVMWTALDDIARMYANDPAGKYAKETLKNIHNTYGK